MSLARALMQRPRGGSGGEDRSTEFWSSWGGAWGHMLTLPFWKKEIKPLRKERKNQFSRRRPSPLSSYLFVLIRARNYRFLAMSWRFVWRPPLLGEAGDPDYAELSVRQGHLLAARMEALPGDRFESIPVDNANDRSGHPWLGLSKRRPERLEEPHEWRCRRKTRLRGGPPRGRPGCGRGQATQAKWMCYDSWRRKRRRSTGVSDADR